MQTRHLAVRPPCANWLSKNSWRLLTSPHEQQTLRVAFGFSTDATPNVAGGLHAAHFCAILRVYQACPLFLGMLLLVSTLEAALNASNRYAHDSGLG